MATPQAELPPQSSNQKLILAGQIAFLPTGILQTLLGPMLPLLIVRWTMNDTQAGNLFLVQFLASLIGVQFTGVILARWGFRPAFLIGLPLMACGIATLYLGSPALGLISVAVYGLGLGLIVPSDNLLIAEIGSASSSGANSRARAVSLLNFFWGIGAVFCSLMVAWSAAHKMLPIFLGSVALFLVLLTLAMRNLPFPVAATSAGSLDQSQSRVPVSLPLARVGKDSRRLAVRVGIFSLSRSRNRRRRMDRFLRRAHGIPRRRHLLRLRIDDARIFLGRADSGPRTWHRLPAPFSRTPRPAIRLRPRSRRHRPDALGPFPGRRNCRRPNHRPEFRHVISGHRSPPVATFRRSRPQHRSRHVLTGRARPSHHSVDGRSNLARHRQPPSRPAPPAGSDDSPVRNPSFRLVTKLV